MSFSPPAIRYISSSSAITVPAGQTWIVKHVILSPLSGGTNSNSLTGTIAGTGFRYWDTILNAGRYTYPNFKPYELIMYAGDTINQTSTSGAITMALYYYILEQDFPFRSTITIPNLRVTSKLLASNSVLTPYTIPSGETWIIKVGVFRWSGNNNTYPFFTPYTWDLDITIDGNKMTRASYLVVPGPNGASPSFNAGGCFHSQGNLIMKTGDKFEVPSTLSAGSFENLYVSLAYWILEQDF